MLKIPSSTIPPIVGVDGVNPVVPALKLVTELPATITPHPRLVYASRAEESVLYRIVPTAGDPGLLAVDPFGTVIPPEPGTTGSLDIAIVGLAEPSPPVMEI